MSNETVNIWSHLLGYILFFLLMLWDIAVFIPNTSGSPSDYLIMSLGLLCFQVRTHFMKSNIVCVSIF